MKRRFDAALLVADLGGASIAAEAAMVTRTTPYGWVKRGYIGSTALCRILEWGDKTGHRIDLNRYFVSD